MSPGLLRRASSAVRRPPGTRRHVSKIKRLRAVLTGAVSAAVVVATLPVLAVTAHAADADPLGGQPGTGDPLADDGDGHQPARTPPAGTNLDDFLRHPVLSWTAITTLPVTTYRVQISPNAEFTNNTVTLPNAGGLTTATQYDLPADAAARLVLLAGPRRGRGGSRHAVGRRGREPDSTARGSSPRPGSTPRPTWSPGDGSDTGVVGRTFTWSPDHGRVRVPVRALDQPRLPDHVTRLETTWICDHQPHLDHPVHGQLATTRRGGRRRTASVIGGCGDTDTLHGQGAPAAVRHVVLAGAGHRRHHLPVPRLLMVPSPARPTARTAASSPAARSPGPRSPRSSRAPRSRPRPARRPAASTRSSVARTSRSAWTRPP